MPKTTVTKTITMDVDLAEQIEKNAEKENRTVSNYIETRLKMLQQEQSLCREPQKEPA